MLTFKSKIALALFLLTAVVANAEELSSVRFGSHSGFDRMVCEFTGPVKYEIKEVDGGVIELHLLSVTVGEKFFLPKLPSQIKLLTSVEAFREGDTHIVLEVRGTQPLYAKATELKGQTWRLALDMSKLSEKPAEPEQIQEDTISTNKPHTKSKDDEGPEYIPGDRPMETKYADNEADVEHQPEKLENKQPEHESGKALSPEEAPKQELLAADSLKALEILAEYFGIMGDSDAAKEYASMYLERTGHTSPKLGEQTASSPWWITAAIAFFAGLVGGVLGSKIRWPFGKLTLPALKLFKRNSEKKDKKKDKADELEDDLESLDRAIASEKKSDPKPSKDKPKSQEPPKDEKEESKTEDAPEPAAETVEAAMKESLMDRRVKRVLELSAEKKSLAEIAQELDMGQDEVKLILDLNS
ncbi:MAG: hypothetical protein KDB65_03885 [Calditrichaeota bacterium]|nr:hypothetical protein [Calditrichota bacterium]MCB9368802.1 hypothetical protein [Calditrichota bacterium]